MKRSEVKKTTLYIALILAGLLLGWMLFGGRGDDHTADAHEHAAEAGADVIFTCSMHPQIRQDEPGDCPICGMDLVPVSDGDDSQDDDPYLFTMNESSYRWANVQTMRVGQADAGSTVRLTGRVAANESESRVITAHFPGRIERLFADYTGKQVRRGERLATLYSPEMMQAQQELMMAARNKENQPRLYEAARQRLRLFNLTDAQINNMESSEQATPTLDIYATLSGFLTERAVAEGDYVNTGQMLFTIANLQNVWVELDVYENQLGMIQTGQQAEVLVAAQPDRPFTGKVEFVDPFLNPQTRTSRVRLTVDNSNNILKPGMLVTADITGSREQQLVIPSTAVMWTGNTSVVYVKNRQSNGFTFEFREINTGPRTQNGVVVLSGLSAGEEIAVNGVFAIDAAAQLQGRYSMMSPPLKADLPSPFKENLEALYNHYFNVQRALADDNPGNAQAHGKQLLQQLTKTGIHSLDGEHHSFWMKHYKAIEQSLTDFNKASAIEQMRQHFEPLSEAFIETARTLGAVGKTFYISFCPMVDNDRGAYWLSDEEQILNPYFGDMMLRCGEVREVLRADTPSQQQPARQATQEHVH
jgi:membrane fusion protein, copper/silver efflux system